VKAGGGQTGGASVELRASLYLLQHNTTQLPHPHTCLPKAPHGTYLPRVRHPCDASHAPHCTHCRLPTPPHYAPARRCGAGVLRLPRCPRTHCTFALTPQVLSSLSSISYGSFSCYIPLLHPLCRGKEEDRPLGLCITIMPDIHSCSPGVVCLCLLYLYSVPREEGGEEKEKRTVAMGCTVSPDVPCTERAADDGTHTLLYCQHCDPYTAACSGVPNYRALPPTSPRAATAPVCRVRGLDVKADHNMAW